MTGAALAWERRVLIASMHQEVLAPVAAIQGYAEMLHDEALQQAPAMVPDLERIQVAARQFCDVANRLLDPDQAPTLAEDEDETGLQARIRHDLRNPLNAIKGYGEMLAEDATEAGAGALLPDLARLLDETNRLLCEIETIIDFSRRATGDGQMARAAEEATALVTDLARSIRPANRLPASRAEPGLILVADDNESIRDLLSRRLRRAGHQVETAADGLQAMTAVAATRFDLVLLDLIMPGLNGYEVLGRLKNDPALADVPVIMISALSEMGSIVRCLEAGADDYLHKPIDQTLMMARVDASLERKQARDREALYRRRLEEEQRRTDAVLHNILPASVVPRLKQGETPIADRFEMATILFFDLVDFTRFAANASPRRLVESLNSLFSRFDSLCRQFGVEKIKTIGDAYMAVAGVPVPRPDHAQAAADLALAMAETLQPEHWLASNLGLTMRIGLHSGPLVAGVIGTHKFAYDVWGDTVNIAARIESLSLPGRIHLSADCARLLEPTHLVSYRGTLPVRGKGEMETYFLDGRRPAGP